MIFLFAFSGLVLIFHILKFLFRITKALVDFTKALFFCYKEYEIKKTPEYRAFEKEVEALF